MTTDHISPASSIKPGTPAAQYLDEHGVDRKDYNSFGSRRGNHEVMIRGTFANIRLRNLLLDDVSGGYTRDFTQDGGPQAFIYDAAQNYAAQDIPLVVLGVRSTARLVSGLGGQGHAPAGCPRGDHRVVRAHPPVQPDRHGRDPVAVPGGQVGRSPWVWTAPRSSTSTGSRNSTTARRRRRCMSRPPKTPAVRREKAIEFDAVVRIDTPGEADYYRNGGILQYVLRNMLRSS